MKKYPFSVTESVLNSEDIPWEVLKQRGFQSVLLMEKTRFYLQLKEVNLSFSSSFPLKSSPSSPFSWPQWSSPRQWSGSPRSQRCSLRGEPPTELKRETVRNNPPWLPRRQWVVINHDHILKVLEKFKSMEIYPPCQIWRKVKMFQSAIFDKHWQVHRLILRFNFHHGLSPPTLSPNGWTWLI